MGLRYCQYSWGIPDKGIDVVKIFNHPFCVEDSITTIATELELMHKTISLVKMEHSILTIKNKSESLFLRLDDILYILADGNYCNIYFADGGVLNTLTYQRAEIARMIDEQLPKEKREKFVLLGRFYLVNTDYVLRIQPNKQLLTFRVNRFGTAKKVTIRATAKALDLLEIEMEQQSGTICKP